MILTRSLTRTITGSEPLTSAEAKSHLRIDEDYEDAQISDLITLARQKLEVDTRRTLIASTWTARYDRFPYSVTDIIELPRPPLLTVSHVKYINTEGTLTTWSSSEWTSDINAEPGFVRLVYSYSWPTPRDEPGAVRIEHTAGYAAVDARVKHAMRMLVGHYYENREAVVVSQGYGSLTVPLGYESLVGALSWGGELG